MIAAVVWGISSVLHISLFHFVVLSIASFNPNASLNAWFLYDADVEMYFEVAPVPWMYH